MAGFTAEYKSGDISLQESELSAGVWFKYNELPLIPDKASLARKLIDNWLKQFKTTTINMKILEKALWL